MNNTYDMPSTYELVLESLLVESKVDTYSRRIAQRVIAACKRKMDEIDISKKPELKMLMKVNWPSFIKRKDFWGSPEGQLKRAIASGGQITGNTITLKLEIKIIQSKADGVNVGGQWSPIHDTLVIDVEVGSTTGKLKPQHLQKIQYRSYEVIRHELEHSTQPDEKILPAVVANQGLRAGQPLTPNAIANYFLTDAEVEAFVAGFYHQAKRQRRPFIDLIDEKTEGFIRLFTKRGMLPDVARQIFHAVRKRWLAYAQQRFPNAVVQKTTTV